jgi:hypothetical protein
MTQVQHQLDSPTYVISAHVIKVIDSYPMDGAHAHRARRTIDVDLASFNMRARCGTQGGFFKFTYSGRQLS